MAKKLPPKQKRFVEEYLIDLNASQSAVRAGYRGDPNTVGPRLLANVGVSTAIAAAMKARSARTEITADKVLQRWWQMVNVDVNELVEYRRTNCRYCWGFDHAYQWADNSEYQRTVDDAKCNNRQAPSNGGGFGFVEARDANPACPKCSGEGYGHIHVHDSRKLSGAARQLYAGVHQGKDGLRVLLEDRAKALENVARHLGMFNDKMTLLGPNGGPLQAIVTTTTDPLEAAKIYQDMMKS